MPPPSPLDSRVALSLLSLFAAALASENASNLHGNLCVRNRYSRDPHAVQEDGHQADARDSQGRLRGRPQGEDA